MNPTVSIEDLLQEHAILRSCVAPTSGKIMSALFDNENEQSALQEQHCASQVLPSSPARRTDWSALPLPPSTNDAPESAKPAKKPLESDARHATMQDDHVEPNQECQHSSPPKTHRRRRHSKQSSPSHENFLDLMNSALTRSIKKHNPSADLIELSNKSEPADTDGSTQPLERGRKCHEEAPHAKFPEIIITPPLEGLEVPTIVITEASD